MYIYVQYIYVLYKALGETGEDGRRAHKLCNRDSVPNTATNSFYALGPIPSILLVEEEEKKNKQPSRNSYL